MDADVLGAARQLYEGARPTAARIGMLCGLGETALAALASAEGWRPLPASRSLKRRIAAMADKALALMEQAEGDTLLEKSRLDLLSALMKAIDRLGEQVERAEEATDDGDGDALVTGAFAVIDRRIEELAHAYAERLVEAEPDGGAAPGG